MQQYQVILGNTWLEDRNPDINWKTKEITIKSGTVTYIIRVQPNTDIEQISASQLRRAAKKKDAELFAIRVNKINEVKEERTKLPIDPRIQTLLKKYSDVFPEEIPSGPPPERSKQHTIDLEPGAKPQALHQYRLSQVELDAAAEEVERLLQAGIIEESTSPWRAPILFVRKKDGKLRMCIDYRRLNKHTIANMYPIPIIDEMLDHLQDSEYFTLIDLRSGYHQVLVAEKDREKTAFSTRRGHYHFIGMPFGLRNAPATFQALMNEIFKQFINKSVLVYIDDILIYSPDADTHIHDVEEVLKVLREQKLYAQATKCSWMATEIKYLGHIIKKGKVMVDPAKTKAVEEWPQPENVSELRGFLGLSGYYRRFVPNYSGIAKDLTDLLHKDVPYIWKKEHDDAFQELKRRLVSAPVMHTPKYYKDKPAHFECTTDASDYALGAVITQDGHPIAYRSRKLQPRERNYAVHEKELLAIVDSVKDWRHYIEGQKVTVFTDHQSLTHFMDQPGVSQRQVRWLETLLSHDLKILYMKGKENVAADGLSRRSDLAALSKISTDEFWMDEIRKASLGFPMKNCKVEDGLVYKRGRLYIPDEPRFKLRILQECHDSPLSGHFGLEKTFRKLQRSYFWPTMGKDTEEYVASCDLCQRNKPSTQKPYGLLQSIPPTAAKWKDISMDFMVKLPKTKKGYDAVIVFVDRFTKAIRIEPMKETDGAVQVAHIFFKTVFRHHGIPHQIICDRDARFTSNFWKELMRLTETKVAMSTAYHPQTDGQTERANRTIQQALRNYINYAQTNWDELLIYMEFAYNNSVQGSTQMTPFELLYGEHPSVPADLINRSEKKVPAAHEMIDQMTKMVEIATQNIKDAQSNQKKHADKKRREHDFKIGDLILLSVKNIDPSSQILRPTKKLQFRFDGPFKIIHLIGEVAAELDLQGRYRIHPVFHVSNLKHYKSNDDNRFPGRLQTPPPPIEIDNAPEYEVESILDKRTYHRQTQYLVKWRGFPDYDATWEPLTNLTHAKEAIADYEDIIPTRTIAAMIREDLNKYKGEAISSLFPHLPHSHQTTNKNMPRTSFSSVIELLGNVYDCSYAGPEGITRHIEGQTTIKLYDPQWHSARVFALTRIGERIEPQAPKIKKRALHVASSTINRRSRVRKCYICSRIDHGYKNCPYRLSYNKENDAPVTHARQEDDGWQTRDPTWDYVNTWPAVPQPAHNVDMGWNATNSEKEQDTRPWSPLPTQESTYTYHRSDVDQAALDSFQKGHCKHDNPFFSPSSQCYECDIELTRDL